MTVQAVLRAAHRDDVERIAEIWHIGWSDGHLGHVSDALLRVRTEASFLARSEERIVETTVASVGGVVAGFVTVVGDEVEQVYVAREHRGAGVADVLLDEAERQVCGNGHASAWLAVVAGNGRARTFYEKRVDADTAPM